MQTRNIFVGEASVGKAASRNKAAKRPPPLRLRALSYLFIVIVAITGLSSPLQAASRSGEKINGAVWQIEDDSNYGTAFAISPNLFITNAHNLRDAKRIGEIVLSQEGSSRRLSASQILALSLVHDLLLLQTKETVRRYLRLGGPVSSKEDGALHILGYRKQTLTRFRQIEPIPWQDRFYYALAVNRMDLSGASGSPVLNSRGEVVAIASRAGENLSFSLKAIHVERLLTGKIGVFCPHPRSIQACRKEGIAKMIAMAERGHGFARFRLGLGTYTNEGKPLLLFLRQTAQQGFTMAEGKFGSVLRKSGSEEAAYWLRRAADKGSTIAKFDIGMIHYERNEARESCHMMKQAGESGHAPAQFNRALCYFHGWGMPRDREAARYWLERSTKNSHSKAREFLEKHLG